VKIESKETHVLGVRTHYLEKPGEPSCEPLLLLHGFASGAFVWKDFMRTSPLPNPIFAPDLPGNGSSGQPLEDPTLDYYARFVDGLLGTFGIDKFSAIGHSMGSAILAVYSVQHQSIRTMILESPADDQGNTPLLWRILSAPVIGNACMAFYPPTRNVLLKRLQRGVFEPGILSDEYFEESWNAFTRGPLRVWIPRALRIKRSVIEWQKVPSCAVVYGEQDRVVSERFRMRLKANMTAADFHAFDQCMHIPHLEHPVRFHAIVQSQMDKAREPNRG
jgi:pimeloyl-ACP methyl ester carboxylesterase